MARSINDEVGFNLGSVFVEWRNDFQSSHLNLNQLSLKQLEV